MLQSLIIEDIMFDKKIAPALFSIFIVLLLLISCGKNLKKIPITTSSEKAKELYLKGLSLNDRLRGFEAVTYFDDAIALDSNFAMAYLGKAFSSPNPNQFFPNIQKALSLKDKISEGEQMWIDAVEMQANNQLDKLTQQLNKLITLYPDDERIYNFLGTIYFGNQDYKQAIDYYLKAIEINPKFSPVYNQLGYSYRFLQNYNEAETMFQKYIELIPNDPNPYDSYGELLLQIGKYDESIKNYEKALSVNPYFTFSYLGIASNLNYTGEYVVARNRLQQLLTTANTDTQRRVAYNGIIISYIDEGNLNAAYKMTQTMREIAIKEMDSLTMINELFPLGALLVEMGRYDEARAAYDTCQVLISHGSFFDATKKNATYNLLASYVYVDAKQGKFDEASKNADKFNGYAEEQNNPTLLRFAHQLYGVIALEEQNYELAIEHLRKADQSNPYNLYRIGLAYENLDDSERAQSFFNKAAHANLVSSRNYSYIRKKALAKLSE